VAEAARLSYQGGVNTISDDLRARITAMITADRIVVFMKGSQMMPMCGFSATALATLKAAGAEKIKTHNVLADQELREGLKVFSGWPTIPQVFIDGQLVGGADIVTELHNRGELATLIKKS
jgi:monothiol glutaredoxin